MSFVSSELRDGICILRLDHGKPNSISEAVSDELSAALVEAEKSADAIALFGKPGMWSGGFDLPTMRQGAKAAAAMVKAGGRLLAEICEHPKPIVAGCGGHAIAMGAFLVLACDLRIGARGDFKIGANETAIGMTLPTFGIELARARLSKRHYDRAIVQSTIYDPAGALAAGFLDELVDPDELEARVLEAATQLAQLQQPAFRNNKRQAHRETIDLIRATLEENIDSLIPN